MADFAKFRDAVNAQFSQMAKNKELFRVDLDKHQMWDAYLSAFPEGTNPIYRERTEHDCNCCKQFVRDIGNVVTIEDGKLVSVWDAIVPDETYQAVANALAERVRKVSIKSVFRHNEGKVGKSMTRVQGDDGTILKWDHFAVTVPRKFLSTSGDSVQAIMGQKQADFDVLKRSLEGISLAAIDVVLELIEQNSLYRGQEHLQTVKGLRRDKVAYDKLTNFFSKEQFLWETVANKGSAVRYRNTVIGTVLTDISEGVELERAVKSFEEKMAPSNYKRPTALITAGMIQKAEQKVEDLGIESALQRRFAVPSDLTINNVRFADRSTKTQMKGGVFDDLKPTAKDKTPDMKKVQEIGIKEFIDTVLPKADSLELLVENRHQNNLFSLVAPVHADAPNIFKWDNNFSWSYAGEVTDSIKERVKSAGGDVDGDVRVSLSWFNGDDLDIHIHEPNDHIFFGHKMSRSTGGRLDVDMNAGGPSSRTPVENVTWKNKAKMAPGKYKVVVNNYNKRETKDVGFEVEVQIGGQVYNYSYEKPVRNGQNVEVLTLNVSKDREVTVSDEKLTSTRSSKEVWGINTEQFVKVDMVMDSPNHWDGQEVGNKHWFFVLDGCKNPDPARGFYNEFLSNELTEHRKVFEVLGSKMKTEESDEQLSGVGFSSTQNNAILCKVSGSFNRVLKINF